MTLKWSPSLLSFSVDLPLFAIYRPNSVSHMGIHVYFASEENVMPARAQQELMGDLGLEPAFLGPC